MKKNRLFTPLLFLLPLACALCSATTPSGEVSRTPPAIYEEKLEPRLTTVGEAKKLATEIHDKDAIGIILIDERLHWVDAQGRRTMARHSAYKSLTEAAVEHNASDTFTYRKHDQKFTLVLAETIQPDGTVLPVKASAIILQTPQRQADNALFDDLAEVRVIFPNVKPGSITRAITVIEDLRTRMPGEYTQWLGWGYGWPTAIAHQIIDMPDSLSRRVRLFPVGTGVPAHTVETTGDGRVLYNWDNRLIPARKYEVRRAPSSQAGPAITLTSIASWEDIGRWYAGLVSGRDKLAPTLAAKVDEWTRGLDATSSADARDEIIRILFAKVTNDVRYTGLEFGDADYQPHDCNEVWENQYGDCKDKSNLLVAFLRHKNIPAHIALINTDHLGVIDRRAPNFRVFDHAIVAIPDASLPEGHLFCDPTISWAEPGELHNGDTDRDVFVINETAGSWARTPPQKGQSLAYDFDLQLSANGELSGWLAVTAEGHSASGWRGWTRRYDIDGLRRNFQQHIRPFYDGANVIDVVIEPAETTSGPCVAKTYFIVPGRDAATHTLSFPVADNLLPRAGNSAQRETNFPLSQGRIALTAAIKLPPGTAPSKQPDPYHVATPSCTIATRWDYSPLTQTCRAQFEIDLTQPAVSATEFARFYQALQSLRAWLQQPLVLATTSGQQSATISDGDGAAGTPEIDFPMMPTGDGQIELADTRYPVNGNRALARAALEKTLQYFPSDKPTVFTATVNLARIDWYADENQKALDRITPLLAGYKNDVTPNLFAWGEYIQALVLHDLDRDEESLAICERLALDTGISAYRRSHAALHARDLLEKTDPAKALVLLDAVANLRASEQSDIIAAIARLRLRQNENDALRSQLDSLLHSQPSDGQSILASVIETAAKWEGDDTTLQPGLVAIIDALVPEPSAELGERLAVLRSRITTDRIARDVQTKLKAALSENPDVKLHQFAEPNSELKTFADYKKAAKTAEEQKNAALCAHLYLQSLITLPVDNDFSSRLLQTVLYLEWKDRQRDTTDEDPLFRLVCDLCELFPRDNRAYCESHFQRANYLIRRGNNTDAKALYEKLTRSPETPKTYLPSAYAYLGLGHEKDGDYAAALLAYKEIESSVANNHRAADAVLRAVFINLHEDRPEEALRIIKVLEACTEETLKKAQGSRNIRGFLSLVSSGQATEFWTARTAWWPQWQEFEKKHKFPPIDHSVIAAVITDPNALRNSASAANAGKKFADFAPAIQRIASAARWLPSIGSYMSSTDISTILPSAGTDFLRICIALLRIPVSTENHLRERQFQLAYALMTDKQNEACLKAIADFKKHPLIEDWMTYNIHRIWAQMAIATKKQMSDAADALERDLTNPNSTLASGRDNTVTNLANLYRAQDRIDAEAKLLERESAHPWFVATPAALNNLKRRSTNLAASKQFAGQVSAWLRDNPIPWYDYAEPARLDDPRLRNLNDALLKADNLFSVPEAAKFKFLVAQSVSVSQEAQRTAMSTAYLSLVAQMPSHAQTRSVTNSLVNRPDFDADVKRRVLLFSLWMAFNSDRKDDFTHINTLLRDMQLTPDQKKLAEEFGTAIDVDRFSPESLAAAIRKLAEVEIENTRLGMISAFHNNLLQLGDLDTARQIMDEAQHWRISPATNLNVSAIVFDFARNIRAVETLQPIHEALRTLVIDRMTNFPEQKPAALADLCYPHLLSMLNTDDQCAACLWLIKNNAFERAHLDIWHSLITACNHSGTAEETTIEILRVALEKAADDETRALIANTLPSAYDLDNPAIYKKITALFAPLRDPVANPQTCEILQILDVRMALRTGAGIDPQTALAGLKTPEATRDRFNMLLRHYVQQKDKPALKQFVTTADSSQLLSIWNLFYSISAFDLLGMKTEASMARNIAKRELRKIIVETWAGSQHEVQIGLKLAEILDDPALLPDEWISAIATQHLNTRIRTNTLLVQARVKKEWAAVLKNAEKLNSEYPTYYAYYWNKAEALWNLGRKAEAKSALETYTRYSKDEIEYPEAMRMLAELQ